MIIEEGNLKLGINAAMLFECGVMPYVILVVVTSCDVYIKVTVEMCLSDLHDAVFVDFLTELWP